MLPVLFVACSNEPEMDDIALEQQKLDYYRDFEKAKGSKQISGFDHGRVSKNFFPNPKKLDLHYSLMYYRPDASILPMKCKYFFTPEDSLVELIVYEWNLATPEMDFEEVDKLMLESMEYHEQYVGKYNQAAEYLYDKFGEPVEGDKGIKKETLQNIERWHGELHWKEGNKHILLSISMIPKLSYRVFCKIYWEE